MASFSRGPRATRRIKPMEAANPWAPQARGAPSDSIWNRAAAWAGGQAPYKAPAAPATPGGPPSPYPGFLTPQQMRSQAAREVEMLTAPQRAYYEKLIASRQKDAQGRAAFVRDLFKELGVFQQGIAPQIAGIYQQAGQDQSGFAKGFADGMQKIAEQEAGDVNQKLRSIGAPEGQMLPSSSDAANALYAVGGRIPANTFAEQGAAFGSAASYLPAETFGLGMRQAKDALAEGDREAAELRLRLEELAGEQPGRVLERMTAMEGRQDSLADRAFERKKYADDVKRWGVERADNLAAARQKRADEKLAADQARADAFAVASANLEADLLDTNEKIRHNQAIEQNSAYSAEQRAAATAANVELDRQKLELERQKADLKRREVVVKERKVTLEENKPPYVPPGKSRATLLRNRQAERNRIQKALPADAARYAKSGLTRAEAFRALEAEYDGWVTTHSAPGSGRAKLRRQLRAMIHRALVTAGFPAKGNGPATRGSKAKAEKELDTAIEGADS